MGSEHTTYRTDALILELEDIKKEQERLLKRLQRIIMILKTISGQPHMEICE